MITKFWQGRNKETPGPSEEAKAALAHAKQIRQKSETVYAERAALLHRNHFAERIRILYTEGL